jgi:general secretion pathway protein C
LVEIGRGRVTLRNGEHIEIIEAGAELPPPPKSKPDAKAPNPPSPHAIEGAADAIDCKGDHCRVDRAFVEQLLANPGALTKQARISPSKSGFKFYGVRPDSLPKLLGMRNGDTLTHVNGTPLRSLDQAMGLYTKLRRASHLSVTLERKGKSVQKEIDIE